MSARSIALRPFPDPAVAEKRALLDAPELRRHLPPATGLTDEAGCRDWMRAKAARWPDPERLWPRSVYIDDEFAGWGGLQPERDVAAGIAPVLNRRNWGGRGCPAAPRGAR